MDEHDITEQAFKNGYEKGKQDAVKWIPVTERLPEVKQPVLAWTKYGGYHEAALWTGKKWLINWDFDEIYGVTHWMPLPEAPKGE